MATAFSGDSKTTFFHGWARGPSAKLRHPRCLQCCIESKAEVLSRPPTRALQNCGQIFRYAIATGRAERDPTRDLKGALPPPKEKHHASITDPKRIAELLRAIDAYQGYFVTKCALRLALLLFVHPATGGEQNGRRLIWRKLSGVFPQSG